MQPAAAQEGRIQREGFPQGTRSFGALRTLLRGPLSAFQAGGDAQIPFFVLAAVRKRARISGALYRKSRAAEKWCRGAVHF